MAEKNPSLLFDSGIEIPFLFGFGGGGLGAVSNGLFMDRRISMRRRILQVKWSGFFAGWCCGGGMVVKRNCCCYRFRSTFLVSRYRRLFCWRIIRRPRRFIFVFGGGGGGRGVDL